MILGFAYAIKRRLSYWKQVLSLTLLGPRRALRGIYSNVPSILEENASDLQNTTHIRNWVNINSIHLIDDEHDSYAFDLSKVAVRVWAYVQKTGSQPHLSCGPRAYLLKQILDHFGYSTRIIDILEVVKGEPRSHTLIEYFDNTLKKWVMQDPDFNACYVDKATGLPLSAEEALEYDKCSIIAASGGYDFENSKNLFGTIDDYFFAVVVYRYCYVGQKANIRFASNCRSYTLDNGMSFDDFKYYLRKRYDFS